MVQGSRIRQIRQMGDGKNEEGRMKRERAHHSNFVSKDPKFLIVRIPEIRKYGIETRVPGWCVGHFAIRKRWRNQGLPLLRPPLRWQRASVHPVPAVKKEGEKARSTMSNTHTACAAAAAAAAAAAEEEASETLNAAAASQLVRFPRMTASDRPGGTSPRPQY